MGTLVAGTNNPAPDPAGGGAPAPWLAGLRAVYQPIVDIDTGLITGYEALARGAAGSPWETPDRLFAAATAAGRLAELDWACRVRALQGFAAAPVANSGLTLFVNVEPLALDEGVPPEFQKALAALPPGVQVLLEITERAIVARPRPLLQLAARARELGLGLAVDDVGADLSSLAFMPFLQPDVVKLDLRLVQQRTTVEIAETVNAVNAQAALTGAVVLAEGIETEEQAERARAMGARLVQGWHYGRPGALPQDAPDPVPVPIRLGHHVLPEVDSPWSLVADHPAVRRSTKPLLVAMSKHLERQAFAIGGTAVVLGAFQDDRHFTPATKGRYTTLANSGRLVAALGARMPADPAPGVRGGALAPDDPLCAEWTVAVVGPHFAAALIARDLGDSGAEADRRFDYLVTYDRETSLIAASSMLARVPSLPDTGPPVEPDRPAVVVPGPRLALEQRPDLLSLLPRAVDAARNGITIADARAEDMPLVYVNAAFLRMSGYAASDVLGRNCRILQGADTDRDGVRAISELVRAGREARATLRNYRADGTPWWNELTISPVHDDQGRLTHFVGVQDDVTARVEAEQWARFLAEHDPLTRLPNRARAVEYLTEEIARSLRTGTSLACLSIGLDHFRAVNATLGHTVGDAVLVVAADRLQAVVRTGDLVARTGGDEFLVVLVGLRHDVDQVVTRVAREVLATLATVVDVAEGAVAVTGSVGVSRLLRDGATATQLLAHADAARTVAKQRGGGTVEMRGRLLVTKA